MNLKKNLMIIGAGNLGRRYLEGCLKSELDLNIWILDINEKALKDAFQVVQELNSSGMGLASTVSYVRDVPFVSEGVDLCIVSTTSASRAEIVQNVSRRIQVSAWVLEKVLAQSEAQLDLIQSCLIDSVKVWVNHPRRMMNWHQQIKSELGAGGVQVDVRGGNWGLACNSLHFIDLISWWTGSKVQSVDTRALDSEWFESSRRGYFETYGKLRIEYYDGSKLSLFCGRDSKDVLKIDVATASEAIQIIESEGSAVFSNGRSIRGKIDYQSELTQPLIKQILNEGHCHLTSLSSAIESHRLYLRQMLNHWNTNTGNAHDKLPVT